MRGRAHIVVHDTPGLTVPWGLLPGVPAAVTTPIGLAARTTPSPATRYMPPGQAELSMRTLGVMEVVTELAGYEGNRTEPTAALRRPVPPGGRHGAAATPSRTWRLRCRAYPPAAVTERRRVPLGRRGRGAARTPSAVTERQRLRLRGGGGRGAARSPSAITERRRLRLGLSLHQHLFPSNPPRRGAPLFRSYPRGTVHLFPSYPPRRGAPLSFVPPAARCTSFLRTPRGAARVSFLRTPRGVVHLFPSYPRRRGPCLFPSYPRRRDGGAHRARGYEGKRTEPTAALHRPYPPRPSRSGGASV
eukprot:tig00000269_g23680.t1